MTDWSAEKEKEWIEAAKRDRREFARLYDAYADRVYRYLLRRTAHVQRAEDLTQETFLKALAALRHYEWRGVPFGAWLFRIARNTMLSAASDGQPTVELDETVEPSVNLPLQKIETELVWQKTKNLTDEQQEALTLRYRADLPIAEIALAMDKSEAAVKMLLQRAVNALKGQLN
ncbi:sigma-70 family RNA polymerase sigma factor [Patescibacteria group bacterium]|nr:MAG: sigma-70 family RNA polymerase sigma factor [Patescibacteria group bacterium]